MSNWYRRYPGDYLRDTMHLTLEECGAYDRLMDIYYSTGEPIPNDIDVIKRYLRESKQKTRKIMKVLANFFEEKHGLLYHKRIEFELAKSLKMHKTAVANGRAGGKANALANRVATKTKTKTKEDFKRYVSLEFVEEIFNHWKITLNHPRSKIDDNRKKLIKKCLKDGYTKEDLCKAITGCSLTPHNMGQNDNSQRYDSIELILRNNGQIDRFMKNADNPPGVGNGSCKQTSSEIFDRGTADAYGDNISEEQEIEPRSHIKNI